ncbi:MAG: glycosyltransferase [Bryobacteraceae bacterium]
MTTWHFLDTRMVWVREFAAAVLRRNEGFAWMPALHLAGCLQSWEREDFLLDPPLRAVRFPLQRGFHIFPFSVFEGRRVLGRLLRRSADPRRSVLVCSLPQFAEVVEAWPGPSVYYATDLFTHYKGWNAARVARWERRLCRAATLVCPNSERIAERFLQHSGCPAEKIAVVPNAVRAENLLPTPLPEPAAPPPDMQPTPRPIAGVIGNLGANTNWTLLEAVIERTPWLSWVFVGPAGDRIADVRNAAAREAVMHSPRARFLGEKPYGVLKDYARAFDVAVLPYSRREPTFSGSSTRFYEHLAACRPMLATRGFDELLEKPPLLALADTPDEMTGALERLRANGFRDGFEELRWRESQHSTWDARAASMCAALRERLSWTPSER